MRDTAGSSYFIVDLLSDDFLITMQEGSNPTRALTGFSSMKASVKGT